MPEEALSYIRENLAKGASKESIYLALLNKGWKVDDINDNFEEIAEDEKALKSKAALHKRTIHIIVIVGALLIGAGIFSFIASNWQYMSKPLKIGIIIASMLASYISGWVLKEKYEYKMVGNALLFLGALIYGAGIFLIGQMFNIRANWPDGFLLWMLGVLALAYALELFELLYLAIILGIVALVGHPFNIIEGMMGRDAHLLTSTGLLLVTTIVLFTFAIVIRHRLPEEIKKLY